MSRLLGGGAFGALTLMLASAAAAQAPGAVPETAAQSPMGASPTNQATAGGAAETAETPVSGGLDEIVVTAQRRIQNAQDVPISVVAVGGEALKTQGIRTIEQLNRIAPNAVIERVGLFPGAASLSMRGVGYSGIESFTDPDVSVYVNGIYNARNATALSQTLDLASIEVLRGPQGTLFGRNAYAGTISVQTNRPDMNDTTGSASATIGNFGLVDVDVIGNLPIIEDKIAGRVAVRSHNLGGLWHNSGIIDSRTGAADPSIAGKRIGEEKSLVVRPSLRFTPTERLDIQFIGEFLREKDEAAPILSVPTANLVNGVVVPTSNIKSAFGGNQSNPFGDKRTGIDDDGSDPYTTGYSQGLGPMKFHVDSYTLDASYDTGYGSLRFLGNHQKTNSEVWADTDGSVANLFSSVRYEDYKATSGEIQFVSDFSERFDVVAGAFAFHDQYKTTQLTFTNSNAASPAYPPIFNQNNYLLPLSAATAAQCAASFALPNTATSPRTQANTGCVYPGYVISYINNGGKRNAYAAYAQSEFHVTDQLGIVAGVRYSSEKKYGYYGANTELGRTGLGRLVDGSQHLRPTNPAVPMYTAAPYKDDNWSPRIGVNYKLTPDVFLFGFWQCAYKSGGFNAGVADDFSFRTPYTAQKVDNFEGGIKSEFFDRKLRVNVQGFYAKYKDLQRSQVTPSPTAASGVVTVVTNTADIKSYGVEAEIAAKPIEQLTLFVNLGWNKAQYTRYCVDFDGAAAVAPGRAICGPIITLPVGTITPQDYSSNNPLRAPRWDITAGFTKDFTIGTGTLSATGSVNHRSSVDTDLVNRVYSFRPKMTLFDASLKYAPDDGGYSLTVWGRNLTNKVEILGYTPVAPIFSFASPTQPRTYGITGSINF